MLRLNHNDNKAIRLQVLRRVCIWRVATDLSFDLNTSEVSGFLTHRRLPFG
jgi:hypothetical protein